MARLTRGLPLSRQQQTDCSKTLQSAWESLDRIRDLLDPNATAKPCGRAPTDLDRGELFDGINDLREQYTQLCSASDTGVGSPERTQGDAKIPAQQVAQHLTSIKDAIDDLSNECESLDIRIPRVSVGTADKLSKLETRLAPLRKYVQELEDEDNASQPQATESSEGSFGSIFRGRLSTGATALLVGMSLFAGAAVKSSQWMAGGEGGSLA